MTIDLLQRYEATLVELLRRLEDHRCRADLCSRVLDGETWEQVLGAEGKKPCTSFLLAALKQLDEIIGRAGSHPELNRIVERVRHQMLKESSKRDRVAKETEPLNLPPSSQPQISAQFPQTLGILPTRPLSTQIRIPTKLVKCPIPLSSTFSGSHLVCTWGDLLWATISVGRPGLSHMMQHGLFSWYEMAYRLCMVKANLGLTSSELVKTGAFTALDPSEKNAISYFFGLSFVKLFAGLALDVPWLLHVDRYRVSLGVTTSPTTNIRPDLIGCDAGGDWFVFEAKGRSGAFSTRPIATGKYQLAQLLEIQGSPPKMRLAAQTYFRTDKLAFHCEDPEPDPVGYGIDISDDAFFGQYYGPIVEMLDRLPGPTQFIDFTGIGVSIGLDPDIYQMFREKEWEGIRRWAVKSKHQNMEDLIVGRDGLMVRTLRGPSEQSIAAASKPPNPFAPADA